MYGDYLSTWVELSGPAGQLFEIALAKVKSPRAVAGQLRLKGRSLWKLWQQALLLQEGRG